MAMYITVIVLLYMYIVVYGQGLCTHAIIILLQVI